VFTQTRSWNVKLKLLVWKIKSQKLKMV